MVVWIIGLSGSGKTTLGQALQNCFRDAALPCVLVDGDRVRELFGSDLGYTVDDRKKNAERIFRLCKFLADEQVHVVCAILSIVPELSERNREAFDEYFEVFLDAPLPLLIERDSKQLYANAVKGTARDVVGIDIPFPIPATPDLRLEQTFARAAKDDAQAIFTLLSQHLK